MRKAWLAAAALAAAAVGGWALRQPARTPEMRGARLAGRLGCFACHGPGGTGGVPNAGAEEGEVPSWTGGTLMMYVRADAEIREWIADGAPARLAGQPGGFHPAGLLRMPAFRTRVSARDLDDLAAYVLAAGEWRPPHDPVAAEGFKVAGRLGCFGCHGPQGRAGVLNPGSYKGVIPPWSGSDFAELVHDDAELRAWIRDGSVPRFDGNPLARFFLARQLLHMPAYGKAVSSGELDALVGYIHVLRATPVGARPGR